MLITKFIEIDLGHRVTNHKSKCRNLHGHRYKIVVGVDDKVVTTRGVSDEGMVIDFSDLKDIMMKEIDSKFDHGFTIYEEDPLAPFFRKQQADGMRIIIVPFIPTAENLAKHWFEILKEKLLSKKISIEYVEVYETPTSTAKYSRENWVHDNAKKI
jgi:6-pyruvoyltetrahydropterin/6-carboxytetrahydropterin synthase